MVSGGLGVSGDLAGSEGTLCPHGLEGPGGLEDQGLWPVHSRSI